MKKKPIIIAMKIIFAALMVFITVTLFTAPLEGGYSMAPRSAAGQEERAQAYLNARNKVVAAAKKYENAPYRYGGMTASGLDCSGLICLSFKDAIGVTLPRSSSGLYTWVEKIPIERAQPGDLLFFKTDNTGNISHVALYLGDRRFIHAASAGTDKGVIYSNLDESYYSRTFAGAGRAFPEVTGINVTANTEPSPSGQRGRRPGFSPTVNAPSNSGRLLLGAAIAPTWNGFLKDGDLIRGFSAQLRLGADTAAFGPRMIFGLEIRPEYDGALGVFRLPITLSWGPNDQFRIFAGPVLSFGDAAISTSEGERRYSGGTSWLGTAGITAAPFIFKTAGGEFAPYLEVAWQSYFNEDQIANLNADFSAGFRFSTGVRWTIQVN
jgi:probable lipoprotein NlpC